MSWKHPDERPSPTFFGAYSMVYEPIDFLTVRGAMTLPIFGFCASYLIFGLYYLMIRFDYPVALFDALCGLIVYLIWLFVRLVCWHYTIREQVSYRPHISGLASLLVFGVSIAAVLLGAINMAIAAIAFSAYTAGVWRRFSRQ